MIVLMDIYQHGVDLNDFSKNKTIDIYWHVAIFNCGERNEREKNKYI